ncbi:MAG TPA: glycosyltransferase family 4 protein [Solirubrobacterales bacterium]|nr:glycosyltransferase family 4 protein [Solirubrobacterales bacterium]
MSRSILLVAYFYPPCRDTGILRSVAMAKWLRRLGHRVTVLTTSAYGELPTDSDEPVVRTPDAQLWRARLRGKERIDALFDADTYSGRPHFLSKVVVPEPLAVAWAPFARRRALALHRSERFDCVITTSPPESAHTIGRALQRRGVPWVADVRDAWTFEPLRPAFPTPLQRRLDDRMERRLLGAADAVVCVSEPAAEDLRSRGVADPALIPNGWDPETVPEPESEPAAGFKPDRATLLYTGRFGSYGRDPRPLVDAIGRLARERPDAANRFELAIAGPVTEDEARLLSADVAPARITLLGSLPRQRALAAQGAADALLLIAQPTRSQLLNIKLFEYLAAGRPILALAAGTEAGRVVEEIGGETVPADDSEAIAAALERFVAGELRPPPPDAVAPYTYPAPAELMAGTVESAIARRSG